MKSSRKKPPASSPAELLARELFLAPPPAWAEGELSAAVCYPNTYRVGMASLGYQLVWGTFASHPAFRAGRYFAAYAGKAPPGRVGDVAGLDVETPLAENDVIAFSAYYEADYVRIYGMLAGGGVRPWAAERGEFDPFVVLGGPAVTANPEPLAPFADAVVLGDAERSLPAVLDAVAGAVGAPRRTVLAAMAAVPGVYVPPLYRVLYGAPGSSSAVVPEEGAPAKVEAGHVDDLTPYRGGSWFATPAGEFGKLLLLEPIRGCGRGCSFCQTGAISPPRTRDVASLWPPVDEAEGRVRKAGLVGAALADHKDILELADGLVGRGFLLSVSSLSLAARATPGLLRALGASGQRSVALAPEGATEEARGALGKPVPAGRLAEYVSAAAEAGVNRIKLYYITGFPGETETDVRAVGDELAALKKRFKKVNFEARVNPMVPKPRTRYAEAPLVPEAEFRKRIKMMRERGRGVKVVGGSWREAKLQWALGRGDRSLSRWIGHNAENKR